MNWREREAELIKMDEQSGRHAQHVYQCPAGAWTIGWGRNVDKQAGGPGISREEADFMLANDIAACEADLQQIHPAFDTFTDNRKGALLNVRFQLGPLRYRGFKAMIAAVNAGNWTKAALELMDSKMAEQAKERTYRRANALERG